MRVFHMCQRTRAREGEEVGAWLASAHESLCWALLSRANTMLCPVPLFLSLPPSRSPSFPVPGHLICKGSEHVRTVAYLGAPPPLPPLNIPSAHTLRNQKVAHRTPVCCAVLRAQQITPLCVTGDARAQFWAATQLQAQGNSSEAQAYLRLAAAQSHPEAVAALQAAQLPSSPSAAFRQVGDCGCNAWQGEGGIWAGLKLVMCVRIHACLLVQACISLCACVHILAQLPSTEEWPAISFHSPSLPYALPLPLPPLSLPPLFFQGVRASMSFFPSCTSSNFLK